MQSDRRESNARVYVSNLSVAVKDFTEDDLRKQFDKYGDIESVSLKQRDTFSFAFIEYKNSKDAQQAIQAMNRKLVDGKEIKVELSRSNGKRDFNNRDRGGFRGGDRDRRDSGFRGRDDRGPRRDFGDRPRGCFNCNKQGHFARECPEPRKPRDFPQRDRNDRDRDEGYRRRSRSRSGDRHRKNRKRSSSGSRSSRSRS